MKDTILDLVLDIFFCICFFILAMGIGIRIGVQCEREKVQKIHDEIGIKIVKTIIGDKTTYSYIVIDTNESELTKK